MGILPAGGPYLLWVAGIIGVTVLQIFTNINLWFSHILWYNSCLLYTSVVNILEEMKAYAGEAIEPDEWDLAMIEEARAENDGSTMTLDEVCRELGVKL